MILFEIPNEKGEIVEVGVLRIMEMIRKGEVFTAQLIDDPIPNRLLVFEEWYGTLDMLLNRFQTLYVENGNVPEYQNGHFVPLTIVYKANSEYLEDRIEMFNEEMHNQYVLLNSSGLH